MNIFKQLVKFIVPSITANRRVLTSWFVEADNYKVVPFDGEKTTNELGAPIDYRVNYYALRMRAWEAYLKTDVVQNAIEKYCLWIVGAGLKLQSEPDVNILNIYNIKITDQEKNKFIKDVESLFRLYCNMNESTHACEYNIHTEAHEVLKNATIAGDVLCIMRYNGQFPTIEVIDGRHISTPQDTKQIAEAELKGNIIVSGVEIGKKGNHIAYYIKQDNFKWERVLAYGKETQRRQAWLVYGRRHRKSDVRGLSLLASVIETSAKMDRYKEATLGKAEENAKIVMTIEHDEFSEGKNPLADQIAQSFGKGKGTVTDNYAEECEVKASKIAQSTSKQTYNMPNGAHLKKHGEGTDLYFKDFFNVNIDIVYATLGIPPEIAMDKFGGAYSGSRAAIKSWEHKIKVERNVVMKRQYYGPIYDFWMDVYVLNNLINAPGYLEALINKNTMILTAYKGCRFIGPNVPHIDPVKEINAIRTKLGGRLKDVPLITIEQTLEELNSGDVDQVINQLNEEIEMFDEFIIDDNNDNLRTVPGA